MPAYSPSSIQYALETTKVLWEPDRRIDTFGNTRFEFLLISELMDTVGEVRIRSGEVEAAKPVIIRPEPYHEVEFEGFSEKAQEYLEWLKEEGQELAILKYGFRIQQNGIKEQVLHQPIEETREQFVNKAKKEGIPQLAIIEGVDDTWEVSLLRFTLDMIRQSGQINLFDLNRKGLL